MIPIEYRYIDSYRVVILFVYRGTWLASVSWLSSSVPRYLAYLDTWLASTGNTFSIFGFEEFVVLRRRERGGCEKSYITTAQLHFC